MFIKKKKNTNLHRLYKMYFSSEHFQDIHASYSKFSSRDKIKTQIFPYAKPTIKIAFNRINNMMMAEKGQ